MSAAGRPTKMTPALVKKAAEYLSNYSTKHKHAIPSVMGLCKVLKIARTTVYGWANEDDGNVFSDILAEIKSLQELDLTNHGLLGTFNPTITKLILTKHGYSDKQELIAGEGVSFNFNIAESK